MLDKRMSGTLVKNSELPRGSNNRKGSADMKSVSSDGKYLLIFKNMIIVVAAGI
jgi:hypothetical protein